MKKLHLIAALLCALLLTLSGAAAETAEDTVVATVNGESLLYADYAPIESAYLTNYGNSGYDISDEAVKAYVQDLALTAAIENMLTRQDMTARGCYDFDEATELFMTEQGNAAYESALADVREALRSTLEESSEEDLTAYAQAYANLLGITPQDYIDVYRTQYAYVNYCNSLIEDHPVTDEEVQAAYEQRIAEGRSLYEGDVPAFETALSAGEEVWYKPSGYRSILQILLPASGETDEEKLADVKATVEEIDARLESGERFEDLITEYGTDPAFEDESFYATGYQVHRDSILWEDAFVAAAFSDEMRQPGDWSKPFASTLGVHILYYLADSVGGPIELTDEVHDVLAYILYTDRTQTRLRERIDELADSAEVTLY